MRSALLVAAAAGAALATLAAARPAAADCDASCPDEKARAWTRPRFEGGFGLLAGGFAVGEVAGGAIGLHVDGGVRADRLAVLGEYDYLSVGQDAYEVEQPIRGQLHRLGANLRYSLATFGGREVPLRGDMWIEGGAGSQQVQWNGGGTLSRRDLAFGAGGQLTVRIGRERPSYLGFYYAFRGLVARDPGGGKGAPNCAGPCDMATRPSPYDVGAFFNFSGSRSRAERRPTWVARARFCPLPPRGGAHSPVRS